MRADHNNILGRLERAWDISQESTGGTPGEPRQGTVRRRLLNERGAIHLTELMVVIPLGLIVLTGVCMVFQVALRSQAGAAARATTTVESRNALERITRDLRDATVVVPVVPFPRQRVDLQKYTCGNSDCISKVWVRYSCSAPPAGVCKRYQTAVGKPQSTLNALESGTAPASDGSGSQLLSGIRNSNGQIFQFLGRDPASGGLVADYANPIYVQVDLKVGISHGDKRAADPKNSIELSDGLELRNVFVEQS